MKIICIGRNYSEHAKELNNPLPKEPVFFMKPDSALLLKNNPFYIPEFSNNVHYEVEVVVRINRLGKHINRKFAHRYYNEIGLGIDFTARDVQDECKKKGLPWEKAKAFDGSALLGKFFSLKELGELQKLNFHLEKNGVIVQKGTTADMIFSVDEIIEYISKYVTLKIGDLIFTGTPSGVGSVAVNDKLVGYLKENKAFECDVK